MSESKSMENSEIAESESVKQAIEIACKRQANILVGKDIPELVRGHNIFFGIGLITGSNRISKGLGLGVINMACLAGEVQKRIEEKGNQSQIIILVADTHALGETESASERRKITGISEKVALTTFKLLQFLGSPQQNIRVFQASDSLWSTNKSVSYTDAETEDILKAHLTFECGAKVGWRSRRKNQSGNEIFDEHFFDKQAFEQNKLELSTMAFLYGPEWLSLQTHIDREKAEAKKEKVFITEIPRVYSDELPTIKVITQSTSAHNLPLPPYFGDDDDFVLGRSIDFQVLLKQNAFTKQMKRALSTMEQMVKLTIQSDERTKGFTFLQRLADFCRT